MWGPKSEVICLLWPQRGSLSLLRLEEEGFKLNIGERSDLEKLGGSLGSRWVRPETLGGGGKGWGQNGGMCTLRWGQWAVAPSSRTQPSSLPGSQPLALE